MINKETQQHVDQILTLINVVELIQGVSLKGFFLETSKWRAFIAEEEFKAVYDYIVELKASLERFEAKPDIMQMFDKIERDLLKVMICVEHEQQQALATVVISAFTRAGRWTSSFERAIESSHYASKSDDLKSVINKIEDFSFVGSDMVITLLNMIIESNERVIKLDDLIEK
jgi:hypothetical protein